MTPISMNLTSLNLRILLMSALLFAVVGGIMAIVITYAGFSGSGSIIIWLFFSLLMLLLQWYFGPTLIVWMTGAREVQPHEYPQLHEMVAKYARIAGIPTPKLYIVDNPTPNAFAFGRTQSSSAVAVHTGLLRMLNSEEIEGVIAHEIGHIRHRDVLIMTIASTLPMMLYYAVLIFGSSRDDNRGGFPLAAWFGALIAQFLGTLLVMFVSRIREYYADEFSARATGRPFALARALAKISYGMLALERQGVGTNPTMHAFYIASPSAHEAEAIASLGESLGSKERLQHAIEREKQQSFTELFMTHPLTSKRIARLLSLRVSS